MAKIKLKNGHNGQFGGFTPYGNATTFLFAVATNATGAVINSDTTAAVAAGDVIDLGTLPAGMRLDDAQLIVGVGMTSTIKGSLGFVYSDGVNDVTVPQSNKHFFDAVDIAAAARLRTTSTSLVTLPKEARLILTTSVAANAKESDIKVIISGELTGPR